MSKVKTIYLVATYYRTPANKNMTKVKGYMLNEENIAYDEQVQITTKLRDRDLTADVILDLSNNKVVKCRFNKDLQWDDLIGHYARSYPDVLKVTAKNKQGDEESTTDNNTKTATDAQ